MRVHLETLSSGTEKESKNANSDAFFPRGPCAPRGWDLSHGGHGDPRGSPISVSNFGHSLLLGDLGQKLLITVKRSEGFQIRMGFQGRGVLEAVSDGLPKRCQGLVRVIRCGRGLCFLS